MVTNYFEHFVDLEEKIFSIFDVRYTILGANHGSVDKSVQWVVETSWSRIHLDQVRLAVRVKQDVVAKQLVHVVGRLHLDNIWCQMTLTSFFCPEFISSFKEANPQRMLFTTKSAIWKVKVFYL